MAFKAKVLGREELTRRLEKLAPGAAAAAAKAKLEVAQEAARRIKAAAPRDTGEYAANIRGDKQANNPGIKPTHGQPSKDPDATAVYAPWFWHFLEFGTNPHKISAKTSKNLVFVGRDGQRIVTRSVNHPGSGAQPHIFPTWKAFRRAARSKISRAIGKAVRDSMKK